MSFVRKCATGGQFVSHHNKVNVMNPNTLAHDETGSLLTVDANPCGGAFPSAALSSFPAAKYGLRRKACEMT